MGTYVTRWRPVELALLAALALALVSGAASLGRQDALQEKMIRLHVIANSDSASRFLLTHCLFIPVLL